MPLGPRLLQLLPKGIQDRNFAFMERHNVRLADEDIYFLFENPPRLNAHIRNMKDEKHVVFVFFDFWSLVFAQAVLAVEFGSSCQVMPWYSSERMAVSYRKRANESCLD